jgi:hypothetical protein
VRTACPFLPEIEGPLGVDEVARLRGRYDEAFYLACLRYAQSLWLEGKPAQAMLQLNRAFTAEFQGGEAVLKRWPLPYQAMGWIMLQAGEDEFLGNPVRHFQHLATRMSGPRAELRAWRAWACFHVAEKVLGEERFPRDEVQLAKDGVEIPESEEVLTRLLEGGLSGESEMVQGLI